MGKLFEPMVVCEQRKQGKTLCLLIRGAGERSQTHDKPVGVFFCGDPQIDTLMPVSLLNGFALGQGRVGTDVLFPFSVFLRDVFEHRDHR